MSTRYPAAAADVAAVAGIRPLRSLAGALLGGLLLVGLAAAPASADPAGPSDFRSRVTGIVPEVDGVHAEIRGGDTFLEVSVDRGHEVVVAGYTGEPYLRFSADGTVERNRRSAATYLNDSRKGEGVVPTEASDPTAAAVWEKVASDGTYAWHDHRVHWMSDVSPPVDRGEPVTGEYDPWKVPIEVDGVAAAVEGTLTYAAVTSPLPWAAAGLAAAIALGWFGRRRAVPAAAMALGVASALAALVGRAEFAATPGGGNALLWMLPVVAFVAAAVGLVTRRSSGGVIGALASVACLSAWVLLRFQVLTKPVLPTTLPFWFDRATTSVGLGVCVAAAYLAVSSGQLAFTPLEDD